MVKKLLWGIGHRCL